MIMAMLALRDVVSSLMFLLPFAGWLIAEWRGNRTMRVCLGLLSMLVLCGGIYVAIRAGNDSLAMHQVVLHQIDRALQDGDSSRVHHAIETYRKSYETTRSFKNAVWITHWELGRSDE